MLNVASAQVQAVERAVSTVERDSRPARVVTATTRYQAPLEDVWDACTNADRLPRWFLPVSGDLRLGGRYQFEGNAGGEIQRCERPTLVEVTWEYGGDVSWVTVRLREVDDGTEVVLEHTAYVEQERWTEFGPGAVGVGWDTGMMGLRAHLAGAPAVDPAQAEAWLLSEEGAAFVTACAADWGRAAVAAGDDPAAARAAAARTTAAYTGTSPGTDGG